MMQKNPIMEEKQTKIYMKADNNGELGIPEIFPIQEIRGKSF
jgi:hypothetical protein